jgi:SAM-dependent methyltransferase
MTAKRRAPASKKRPAPKSKAASKPSRATARSKAAPKPTRATARPKGARKPASKPAARKAHDVERDRHGNPTHFAAYLARLDDPARAEWQLPDRVVAALKLKKGDVAAEVGSGTGLFTLRMAKAIGEGGRVYAIDVDSRMLDLLAERAAAAEAWGIVGLLAPDGGGLPPEPVDLVLMANVLHHVQDRAEYLRALGTRLRPGGRIAIVDFHDRDLPIGPPRDHRLSREDAISALEEAGLRLVREERFLPHQYFVVAGRRRA